MKNRVCKKFFAMFISLFLMIGIIMPNIQKIFAEQNLEISKYTNVEGTVTGLKASNKGTYNGKWTAKIPLADIFKNFEDKMKKEAQDGHFPWDKDTLDTSASIYYNVTFPQNVKIGNITIKSNTGLVPQQTITNTIDNDKVKMKFKLPDVNWDEIYKKYQEDMKAGAQNRTVDIEIAYTLEADSYQKASAFMSEKITSTGEFSFYPSKRFGLFGFGLVTFKADNAEHPLAKDFANSDVFVRPAPIIINKTFTVNTDLMLNDDTGNKTIVKKKTDAFKLMEKINTKDIKDSVDQIFGQTLSKEVVDQLQVSDLSLSFTAKLALPNELSWQEKQPIITPLNNLLKVDKVTFENNDHTAVVTLKVDNLSNEIKTWSQLTSKIKTLTDEISLSFAQVKFNEQAKPNTNYEVSGSFVTNLAFKANYLKTGINISVNVKWDGKQELAGQNESNPQTISLSLRYFEEVRNKIVVKDKLQGDLLVNDNTQHDQVIEFNEKDIFKVTGLLNVTPIKNKLSEIQEQYQGDDIPTNIAVTSVKNEFLASMELPEGLKFIDGVKNRVTLKNANGKFKISDITIDGKKLSVRMVLSNQIKTLKEIKEAVEGVKDNLLVEVNGITFDTSAVDGKKYTIHGEVAGLFSATAKNITSGSMIDFDMQWIGEQLDGGEDADDPTTNDIKLTVKCHKNKVVQPTENKQPHTPSIVPSTNDPKLTVKFPKNKVVQPAETNDPTNLTLYISILAIAGIAICISVLLMYKNKKNKKI